MSGIFEAYLAGAARELYAGHFADAGDRRRAVARAARPLAPAVADAIEAQNALYAPSVARDAHLGALRRGAVAVVTGQQVGLFLGPLFNFYKAASAIRAARALEAETGARVVPVFWLQTEDHDLPEIAECNVPCAKGTPLALRLPASPAARTSIAHCTLPDEVSACVQALRQEIGNLPHAAAHLERLERHYHPGAGWAAAYAGMLAELFAEEGLVLVNPRDPALGDAATPVHRRALTEASAIADALLARSAALHEAGFAATVHVRPGAPLSFYHPLGPEGPRHRLEPARGGFAEVGGEGTHTARELLAALEEEPLRFSTSVLLRPVLQDTLLPTAVYVGGPAEVAYFAQLAPLYAAFDLAMPLVVPRARLTIVEEKTARALTRLAIDAAGAAMPEDAILKSARCALPASLDPSELTRTLLDPFEAALRHVSALVASTGPGMSAALEKTRLAVEDAVSRLARKYETAELHRDADLTDEVRRMKMQLYPNDMPQERFYGFSYFAARYGERGFVTRVLAGVEPFEPQPRHLFWTESNAPDTVGEARR